MSMEQGVQELEKRGEAVKAAARKMAYLATEVKNQALLNIADDLVAREEEVLAANREDCAEGEIFGWIKKPFTYDQLKTYLSRERLEAAKPGSEN